MKNLIFVKKPFLKNYLYIYKIIKNNSITIKNNKNIFFCKNSIPKKILKFKIFIFFIFDKKWKKKLKFL